MADSEAFHAIKFRVASLSRPTPPDQAIAKALHVLEDWVWNEQERLSSEPESCRSDRKHLLSVRMEKAMRRVCGAATLAFTPRLRPDYSILTMSIRVQSVSQISDISPTKL